MRIKISLIQFKTLKPLIIGLSLLTLLPFTSLGQYTLDEELSFVYLKGTSTLHDWVVTDGKMKGSLKATVESNQLVKINSARITIPVGSLKSGKEAMDKNMFRALKGDSYPEIVYQLKNSTIHNGRITTRGELTVAGVTNTIETKVSQEQEETGKHIKISGEVKLRMSDFNIKPPEFLFGAFKTGDEILVTFHFMFREKN